MKLDLRKYSEPQKEALKNLSDKIVFKVLRHWKMWSRPMKAKACIGTLSKSLSMYGLSQEELKLYLQQENLAIISTTLKHNVELVFPAGLEETDIYQGLIDHDNDAISDQEMRKKIRRELSAGDER